MAPLCCKLVIYYYKASKSLMSSESSCNMEETCALTPHAIPFHGHLHELGRHWNDQWITSFCETFPSSFVNCQSIFLEAQGTFNAGECDKLFEDQQTSVHL